MNKKNKNPSLRFKKFGGPWQEDRLGTMAETYSGGTPAVGNNGYYNGEIPFIRSAEINSDSTELCLSESGLNNSSAKMVKVGDILYALYGATSGEVGRSKINGAINQAVLAIIPNSCDAEFLAQWLRKSKKDIVANFLQGGQGNLSGAIVKALEVSMPTERVEQEKIGEIFHRVDELIGSNQHKQDKLIEFKVALFEKLFPRRGRNIPRLRFKGYENPWGNKTLGNIGATYTGLSGKTKDDFGHGEARFVTYVNVFKNPIADVKGVDFVEIDASQNIVKSGDVLFTTSSETPEEVGMSSVWLGDTENTYLNSFCFGYRLFSSEKIDPLYLAYLLRSPEIRKEFQFLAQGISRYNISKTKVMDIVISVPEDYEEQVKIGKLFFNLDKLIELTQKKYEKLESLKKAMLNKMFV